MHLLHHPLHSCCIICFPEPKEFWKPIELLEKHTVTGKKPPKDFCFKQNNRYPTHLFRNNQHNFEPTKMFGEHTRKDYLKCTVSLFWPCRLGQGDGRCWLTCEKHLPSETAGFSRGRTPKIQPQGAICQEKILILVVVRLKQHYVVSNKFRVPLL